MVWTSTASQRKGSSDAVARQTHDCQMLQLFSSYPNMVSSDCDPYVYVIEPHFEVPIDRWGRSLRKFFFTAQSARFEGYPIDQVT